LKKKTLAEQKNRAIKEVSYLRGMVVILAVVLVSLGPTTYFLATDSKTHLIPEGFTEGFWISSKKADANYLMQMAEFWGGLVLTANATNHDFRMHHLLDHVDPAYYAPMKSMLLEQGEKLKGGISTSFASTKFNADEKKMLVEITGILHLFEGGRPIKSVEATFKMGFAMKAGKIFVRSFEEVKHA
jgi:type IV conjugative transfer system protein TraE